MYHHTIQALNCHYLRDFHKCQNNCNFIWFGEYFEGDDYVYFSLILITNDNRCTGQTEDRK